MNQKYISLFKKFIRENQIEKCFFLNESCAGGIVVAHSIQNSFIMDQLQADGHVYTIDFEGNGKIDFESTGRNKACGYTGFCKVHDNDVFRTIDFNLDSNIDSLSPEQFALFSFRALTREYWSKLNAVKCIGFLHDAIKNKNEENLFKVFPFLNHGSIDWDFLNSELLEASLVGQSKGIRDIIPLYQSHLYQIQKKKFHLTKGVHYILKTTAPFAVCSYVSPVVDFVGEPLNNFTANNIDFLGINIFPQGERSHVVFTWHRKANYDRIQLQLNAKKEAEKEILISKFLLAHSENIVFSKTFIDALDCDDKDAIQDLLAKTISMPFFKLEDFRDINLFG